MPSDNYDFMVGYSPDEIEKFNPLSIIPMAFRGLKAGAGAIKNKVGVAVGGAKASTGKAVGGAKAAGDAAGAAEGIASAVEAVESAAPKPSLPKASDGTDSVPLPEPPAAEPAAEMPEPEEPSGAGGNKTDYKKVGMQLAGQMQAQNAQRKQAQEQRAMDMARRGASVQTGEPMNLAWRLLKEEDDEVPDPRKFKMPQEDYVEALRERAKRIKGRQADPNMAENTENVPMGLKEKVPFNQPPGGGPIQLPTKLTPPNASQGIQRRVHPFTREGTFEGLPLDTPDADPKKYFTRSEPMEIAMQLLKRQTTLSSFDPMEIERNLMSENSNIFIAAKPGNQKLPHAELTRLSDNMLDELSDLKEVHGEFGITSATGRAQWDAEPSFMLTNVPKSARRAINDLAAKYGQQSIAISEQGQRGVDFVTPKGQNQGSFDSMEFEKNPMYSTDFGTGQRLTFKGKPMDIAYQLLKFEELTDMHAPAPRNFNEYFGIKDSWVSLPKEGMDARPQLYDEVANAMNIAYKPVGGHDKYSDGNDLKNEGKHARYDMIDNDQDPYVDAARVFSQQEQGFKASITAHDGQPAAKRATVDHMMEHMQIPGHYIEVSGAWPRIFDKQGMQPITDYDHIRELVNRPLRETETAPGTYTRKIGENEREKQIFGSPMRDGATWADDFMQQATEASRNNSALVLNDYNFPKSVGVM